jgi:hypothetical protein
MIFDSGYRPVPVTIFELPPEIPSGRNFSVCITWVPATFARLSSCLVTIILKSLQLEVAHRRRLFEVAHPSHLPSKLFLIITSASSISRIE